MKFSEQDFTSYQDGFTSQQVPFSEYAETKDVFRTNDIFRWLFKDLFLKGDRDFLEDFEVFTYMYRRFGIPICGMDHYKQLGKWVISTPHPDVFVCFYIGGTEYVWVWIKGELHTQIEEQIYQARRDWYSTLKEWFKTKNKGRTPYTMREVADFQNNKVLDEHWEMVLEDIEWWYHNCSEYKEEDYEKMDDDSQQKVWDEFWDFKKKEKWNAAKEYEKVKTKPIPIVENVRNYWEAEKADATRELINAVPKDSPLGAAIAAVQRTYLDFLRPTNRRDVWFNIMGYYETKDAWYPSEEQSDKDYDLERTFNVPFSENLTYPSANLAVLLERHPDAERCCREYLEGIEAKGSEELFKNKNL